MATTLMSDAAATVPARATARPTKIHPALTMLRTIGRDIQHLLSKPAYDLCRSSFPGRCGASSRSNRLSAVPPPTTMPLEDKEKERAMTSEPWRAVDGSVWPSRPLSAASSRPDGHPCGRSRVARGADDPAVGSQMLGFYARRPKKVYSRK